MAQETDYTEVYGQAEKEYLQGNFEAAARIIDRMAEEYPNDPTILLLRGHIYYYGLHEYEVARKQYNSVLALTEQPELINLANNALEQIRQFTEYSEEEEEDWENTNGNQNYLNDVENPTDTDMSPYESNWENNFQFDSKEWEHGEGDDDLEDPTFEQDRNLTNPFEIADPAKKESGDDYNALKSEDQNNIDTYAKEQELVEDDINPFASDPTQENEKDWLDPENSESFNFPFLNISADENQESEDTTFVVTGEKSSSQLEEILSLAEEDTAFNQQNDYSDNLEADTDIFNNNTFTDEEENVPQELAELSGEISESYELEDSGNLENISNFDIDDQELPDSKLFPTASNISTNFDEENSKDFSRSISETESQGFLEKKSISLNQDKFKPDELLKQTVQVKKGWLGAFENAPLQRKTWIFAITASLVSALSVGVITIGAVINNPKENKNIPKIGVLMSLITGASTFGTTWFLGKLTTNHIKRYTSDLQTQFASVSQGDFNAVATVYSTEEFGSLAAGFNEMTRVILTTTTEAQKRAEDTERAREDLQRQVIRLLDDVEGAARGDLTVKATVTADVLGAVADAFNLTIENLREIVRQVKEAAKQVNQGATDSELFARSQSSDALRMAEELAVTLNSVQMMTDSIQRVAESAREAEQVARSSSVTALRGGEAVEHTVSGILQIRETVSETARKVKRLAEASQEISKIVALIANISSRTNLLALNASIQAAKAGEAGRGFAIVADEVRQLADRAAKALQEIEQIVLQIQSETGSVMMAMEEGLQQVIDVTDRAEQAKGSLNDIIQVSNRIDALVRSITADTVEQRENSRAVAQVMQSVELTAQETSQESQRVAGSLQNLVVIARDLLSSVERFRVEAQGRNK
ncbi:MAG: chemotaxis protein [Gomphosphaeria aponina SAG 52.96 = DSM 107014]|uniref:Chemotaxis protein n=1 Tax=Gomphosphaeria aponina SAG 52.96 = DSM 107014 TaxID=1521640 RepID=A0A941GTD3_9CHRO|nr:chemotaxis protein [Gomphosphaeria aponina SAG 52.96 = DSM 107014]